MVSPMQNMTRLRGRLAELGVTQQDLADHLGINPTLLNHILKGRRPPSTNFIERANAALDRLERAEQAAQAAKEKVLNEGVR